eukprot:s6778_g3.t1
MANWMRCFCVAPFALSFLWAHFADATAPVTTCLPHAIPESDRKNVVVDGESMPLGIWTSSFDSATIVSKIYEILAQERLGYNTIMDFGSTSRMQVFKLAGCDRDPVHMTNARNCGPPRRYHVSMEFWHAASPWWSTWAGEIGEHAPVNLGSIGYQGKEGLYVMDTALQKALGGRGLALEYYRSYNASWFYPARYAAVVSDVNLHNLQTCADSVEGYFPDLGTVYFESTGDADGVEQVNGTTRLKCWQQKWWPAPACRHNVPGCVAVVSGGPGWGWPEMIQQAFFHNMPLAFATAQHEPENYYISLSRELQSLLYWWMPDTTFTLENPSRVIFPAHSPAEYAKQIFKTQQGDVDLTKWAAVGVEASADRAVALARNLIITNDEISQILTQHMSADPVDPWQTACNWLRAKSSVWMSWLPNKTSCAAGWGLVNSSGHWVLDRSLAVGCQACPAETRSVEQGSTRVCLRCVGGDSIYIPCEPRKSEGQADMQPPEEASQSQRLASFSERRMASANMDRETLGNATEPIFFYYSWPYMLQLPLLGRCGSDGVDLRRLCATNISEEYCVLVHRRPGYAKQQEHNVVPALGGCSCANAALEAEQGDISWNFQQLSHATFLRLQLSKHAFLHWSGSGNEVRQYRDVVFGTPHSAMGFIGHPSLLEILRRWAYYEEASLAAEKGESFECSGLADCQVKRFLTVLEWLMVARCSFVERGILSTWEWANEDSEESAEVAAFTYHTLLVEDIFGDFLMDGDDPIWGPSVRLLLRTLRQEIAEDFGVKFKVTSPWCQSAEAEAAPGEVARLFADLDFSWFSWLCSLDLEPQPADLLSSQEMRVRDTVQAFQYPCLQGEVTRGRHGDLLFHVLGQALVIPRHRLTDSEAEVEVVVFTSSMDGCFPGVHEKAGHLLSQPHVALYPWQCSFTGDDLVWDVPAVPISIMGFALTLLCPVPAGLRLRSAEPFMLRLFSEIHGVELPVPICTGSDGDGAFEKRIQLAVCLRIHYDVGGLLSDSGFPFLIRDWLNFHRLAGVDRFVIYDDDGSFGEVEPGLMSDPQVTYFPRWSESAMPEVSSTLGKHNKNLLAIQSNSHCAMLLKGQVDWIAMLPGLDTYLWAANSSRRAIAVKTVFESLEPDRHDVAALQLSEVQYMQGDHPKGETLLSYRMRGPAKDMISHTLVLNPDNILEVGPHFAVPRPGARLVTVDAELLRANHYIDFVGSGGNSRCENCTTESHALSSELEEELIFFRSEERLRRLLWPSPRW